MNTSICLGGGPGPIDLYGDVGSNIVWKYGEKSIWEEETPLIRPMIFHRTLYINQSIWHIPSRKCNPEIPSQIATR